MYVKVSGEVNCHHDIVVVAVAKDFVINNEYQKQKADVIVINGLRWNFSSFERISDRLLKVVLFNNLSINYEDSFEVCEPVTIIDKGILV